MNDTKPVRAGEELDTRKLCEYLRNNLERLPEGNLVVEQFTAGHSNLTYSLCLDEWEAVLRRPPLGPVAPKAHDMEREFTILTHLHPIFPAAPKPYAFCDDETIIGSPFMIMERKRGIVLDTAFPERVAATEQVCKQLSEIMVKQLVNLHGIDYRQTGLKEMGQPDGFMERQVDGWIKRYNASKTDDHSGVEKLMDWLVKHLPESGEPAIIHYDYKLNNAMFSSDLQDMIGLFDWEMTAVGDPLADLGCAMSYWTEDGDPDLIKYGLGKPSVTVLPGFYTRREFIERYSALSGRDVSKIHFYLTFAYFKLAVICQQIYARYRKGQTNDPRFKEMDQTIRSLLQHSLNIAGEK